MSFQKEYFQHIFGIFMGTNLAPILANLQLAMLEKELKNKCANNKKLKWPTLFQWCIDDGFARMEGKKQMLCIEEKFNKLRKEKDVIFWKEIEA